MSKTENTSQKSDENMANFVAIKCEIKEEVIQEELDSDTVSQADEELLKEPAYQPNLNFDSLNIKKLINDEDDIEDILEDCQDPPDFIPYADYQNSNDFAKPSTSNPYECGSCNFSTDKEIVFEIHVRDCTLESRYSTMVTSMLMGIKQRCYFCSFESSDLEVLKAHHNEHSQKGQIAIFQCDKCAYSTENRFQLVTHTLTHNKFKCEQCPYCHTYEKCVIKHSKNHSFSVKLIAACTSCSFEAVDPAVWEGHLTAHKLTGQAIEISCAGCAYRGDAPFNQRSVEVHQKETKHNGLLAQISTFRCNQCDFVTYFRWDFIQHNKTYHPDPTPNTLKALSCGKCAFVARSKIELKNHFDTKHARVIYTCEGCQFQTRRKERYDLHMLNVVVTQKHEKRHHKITELAQYKCQVCHFQAVSDDDLNTHKLLHANKELLVTVTDVPQEGTTVSNVANSNENCEDSELKVEINDNDLTVKSELDIDSKTDLKRNGDSVLEEDSCQSKKIKTSPYKCFYCEFEADKKIEVDRHEKTTHRTFDGLFTCPFCPYETTKRCDLRRHYTRKHQQSFNCNLCAFVTGSKSDYIQHCASHKRDGLRLHQCSVCEYTNERKSMVQRHELTHREMSLFCDLCDYATRRKDDLTRHKSRRHQATEEVPIKDPKVSPKELKSNTDSQTTYKCLSCSFETIVEHDFDKHIDFHKTNDHIIFFKCTECNCDFSNLDLFRIHQSDSNHSPNLITIDIMLYICNLCPYKSHIQNEFDDHTKSHDSSGEMLYKCLGCNFATCFDNQFNEHILYHSENKETTYFKCNDESCDLMFTDIELFKDHKKDTMHDMNFITIDVLSFCCVNCSYRTWRKEDLDLHIKSHKHVTYKCLTCALETTAKSDFNKHMTYHKTNKDKFMFKCVNYCGCADLDMSCTLTFSNFDSFKSHQDGVMHSPDLVTIVVENFKIDPKVPKTLYKCISCFFKTHDLEDLNEHVLSHNGESIIYICNDLGNSCVLKFTNLNELRDHKKSTRHNDEFLVIDTSKNLSVVCSFKTYTCLGCNFKTCIQQEFNDHITNHKQNIETTFFICNMTANSVPCILKFKDIESLQVHQEETSHNPHIVTIDVLTFRCDKCKYKTWKSELIDRHALLHKIKITYKCRPCSFKTLSRKKFKAHTLNHKKNTFYKCSSCTLRYDDFKSLRIHQKTESHTPNLVILDVSKLECNSCSFKAKSQKEIDRHAIRHTVIMFKCLTCNFDTVSKKSVDSHIREHVGNKMQTHYKCSDKSCSKKLFKSFADLRRHQYETLHAPNVAEIVAEKIETRYKCLGCNLETMSKGVLADHIANHVKNKETIFYNCWLRFCLMKFKTLADLKCHQIEAAHPPNYIVIDVLKFKCHLCPYTSCRTSEIDEHVASHSTQTKSNQTQNDSIVDLTADDDDDSEIIFSTSKSKRNIKSKKSSTECVNKVIDPISDELGVSSDEDNLVIDEEKTAINQLKLPLDLDPLSITGEVLDIKDKNHKRTKEINTSAYNVLSMTSSNTLYVLCGLCKEFVRRKSFLSHLITHIYKEDLLMKCSNCDYMTTRIFSLHDHRKEANHCLDYLCMSNLCSFKSDNVVEYYGHPTIDHNAELTSGKTVTCKTCNEVVLGGDFMEHLFSHKKYLDSNNINLTPKESRDSIQTLGAGQISPKKDAIDFIKPTGMITVTINNEQGYEIFKCAYTQCSYSTDNKNEFKIHVWLHRIWIAAAENSRLKKLVASRSFNPKNQYKCDQKKCRFSSNSLIEMKKHLKYHEVFVCLCCNNFRATVQKMFTHFNEAHNERVTTFMEEQMNKGINTVTNNLEINSFEVTSSYENNMNEILNDGTNV